MNRAVLAIIATLLTFPHSEVRAERTITIALRQSDHLHLAQRAVDAEPLPGLAAALLMDGPTAEEAYAGITSAIPAGWTIESTCVEDGYLIVSLGGIPAGTHYPDAVIDDIVEQFAWTVRPFDLNVRLLVGGEPISVLRYPQPEVGLRSEPRARIAAGRLAGKKICISPGHGYSWNGSAWNTERGVTCTDLPPEDFRNVDHAILLKRYLEADGATVIDTREMNKSRGTSPYAGRQWYQMGSPPYLYDKGYPASVYAPYTGVAPGTAGVDQSSENRRARPNASNYDGADLFISLHTNALSGYCVGAGCPTGIDMYYDSTKVGGNASAAYTFADTCAENCIWGVNTYFDATFACRNNCNPRDMDFTEIHYPTAPALLLEFGFHDTCDRDAVFLRDPLFQSAGMYGLYKGVCAYLGTTPSYDGYSAEYVSDDIPSTATAGQVKTVHITFRNRGVAWSESHQFRLGAVGDSDPFAAHRQTITGTVLPGDTYTFTFDMTFTGSGNQVTDWRMVRDGVTWFGDTLTKTVYVSPNPPAPNGELRAFWVDAWHDGFKTAAQCDQLIAHVLACNCNAVVVQMRRRGDTYFPSNIEPFAPDADPNFDALQYLITRCHASNPPIQVHAWIVLLPIWHSDTPPTNPNHPYLKYPQFLTKTDTGAVVRTFDPGHPDCEQYLTDVAMEIVTRYDIDGISFDYSRFGARNEGYNDVSVARFNAAYGRTGTPSYTDAQWSDWRRTQITNLIRKIYANVQAVKPNVCVSSAVVTWYPGPAAAGSFEATRPYYQVFQNWNAWVQEGILDVSFPMCYFDRNGAYASSYDDWMNFSKSHQYSRGTAIGPGIYMNTITNSIYQIRQTRDLYQNKKAYGVVMYSYKETNNQGLAASVFYNALSHPSAYDPNPTPVFESSVSPPSYWWKTAPTKGHLRGTVVGCGAKLDGATVTVTGPEGRAILTDGTAFYAFIDLTPGTYAVTASYAGRPTRSGSAVVAAGLVTDLNFDLCQDTTPPVISNVQVNGITQTSATITWTTDDLSTSQVEYGQTTSYGQSTTEDPGLVTSHSVRLQNLTAGQTYHFRVKSTNGASLTSYSSDGTFTTLPAVDIIIDNLQAGFTGTWYSGTYPGGWPIGNSQYAWANNAQTTDTATATWTPTITFPGYYDVYVWYLQGTNRTTDARFRVRHAGGDLIAHVNQTQNGSQWLKIGTNLPFAAGSSGYVRLGNATGETTGTKVVIADAVRFVLAQPCDQTIAAAMNRPDGTSVFVGLGKALSARFGGYCYLQEPDRSRGLRVNTATDWQVGTLLAVTGQLATVGGERQLNNVVLTQVGTSSAPSPVTMNIADLGGSSPDVYTPGMSGSPGCYNLGLLVRVAGKVTLSTDSYFMLSDGFGNAVKVYSSALPAVNAIVVATGVSSVESGTKVLRTRGANDVQVL